MDFWKSLDNLTLVFTILGVSFVSIIKFIVELI